MKPLDEEGLFFKVAYVAIFSALIFLIFSISYAYLTCCGSHREGAEYLPDFLGLRLKLSDALLSLFTLGLVVTGTYQAIRMRETVDEMKASSELTKQTADAARMNAEALMKINRAFVVSKGFRYIIHDDFVTILHQWENTGNTPTRKMTSCVNLDKRATQLPEDFDFKDLTVALKNPFIAGPKDTKEMFSGVLTTLEIGEIFHERLFFYVWGWGKYHDIFNDDVEHVTKFCYRLRVDFLTTDNATGKIIKAGLGFETYPKNNCADEECLVD